MEDDRTGSEMHRLFESEVTTWSSVENIGRVILVGVDDDTSDKLVMVDLCGSFGYPRKFCC